MVGVNRQFDFISGTAISVAVLSGLLLLTAPGSAIAGVMTDQTISDAVENEMLYDPAVWPQKIIIATHDGVVTLNGVTDNVLEKDRAAQIARTVKSVRSVVNDIKVVPSILKTADRLEDDVFRNQAADSATDSYELSIEATNTGQVTLMGTVDSWQEKELAGIVAKGLLLQQGKITRQRRPLGR